jgi:hypothetical protein
MSKGTVKNIDQPNGTVTIQQATATKVGANYEAAPTDDFKVQDGFSEHWQDKFQLPKLAVSACHRRPSPF